MFVTFIAFVKSFVKYESKEEKRMIEKIYLKFNPIENCYDIISNNNKMSFAQSETPYKS